jgi:hypothetical protein
MYIITSTMYMQCYADYEGRPRMGTRRNRAHKHFQLDAIKIKRAQKVFKAKTETEAIERALDFAIDEHEKNRLASEANERFVRSGVEIKDVYGKLD